jgi:hypothetical protein
MTAPKAIVAGRPYSFIRFVHAKPAMVHKINELHFLLCYWLEYNFLARNVKITIQCNPSKVIITKLVATLLSGVGAHLASQI